MGMRLRGGTALADGVITASLAAQGLKTSASPTATGMVAQGAVDSRPQLNQSRRTAELAEFNRLSETAFDGWPATPVHTNRGRVLERAALQPQILPVDGRREVKPAVVVGQFHLGQAIAAQIDLKAQRIPASLVRILEVGPHRQHGASAHEQRERF